MFLKYALKTDPLLVGDKVNLNNRVQAAKAGNFLRHLALLKKGGLFKFVYRTFYFFRSLWTKHSKVLINHPLKLY